MDKLEKRIGNHLRLLCGPLLNHRRSWGNSGPCESDPSRGALRGTCPDPGWWLMPLEPPGVCVSALFEWTFRAMQKHVATENTMQQSCANEGHRNSTVASEAGEMLRPISRSPELNQI